MKAFFALVSAVAFGLASSSSLEYARVGLVILGVSAFCQFLDVMMKEHRR